MINESKLAGIIDLALAHAKGRTQGTEVTIQSAEQSSSRFALNGMTQNQVRSTTEVSVRVLKNGRQVRLSTDNLNPAAVRRLVDDAVTAAAFLQPDPGVLPLAGKGRRKITPVKRFDRSTANMSAMDRAGAVRLIIEEASRANLTSAGELATGTVATAIGNTGGLYAYHAQTEAHCSITMSGGDSTGWSKAQSPRFGGLNVQELARRAADKAARNVDPVEVPPGKYTVILEPSAVLDLLAWLWSDFAGTSYQDQLSCFLNKVGTQVFGKNITIYDDVYHPLQSGAPFDGEGQSRQALTLVENGVIRNLVYGRRSARKANVESTGHGLAEPNTDGEAPVNIVIAGGDSSIEQMIAGADRAILLTRVWYVREVDQARKIVTGMTRDGTFLVENGRITRAVRNLRFNQSLIDMLNNVVALGPSLRTAGEEGEPDVVPSMMVEGFNFAATTTF